LESTGFYSKIILKRTRLFTRAYSTESSSNPRIFPQNETRQLT